MDIQKLYNSLKEIEMPIDESFNVITFNNNYFGITKEGYITFITESDNPNILSNSQQTKQLFLGVNISCSLQINSNLKKGLYNILICYDTDYENIMAFLQLTNVYVGANIVTPISIKSFFKSLKNLFANKQQIPISELQGLYGELFFMDYIQNKDFDITKYWQSQDKMKFDFSITDFKKIEVKTTTGESRVHKFRHEQLTSDIYDTWIVSIMLRKDDQGLSLYELAERVKVSNPTNLRLHTRITNLLNNYTREELEIIKFNNRYTNQNIGFYRTVDIPKFPDKQPKNVSNTEYDSNLSNVGKNEKIQFIDWIKDILVSA